MTKRRSSEIQKFSQENVEIFGGPRTETKLVKWSASRKRLRTAVIEDGKPYPTRTYGTLFDLLNKCRIKFCEKIVVRMRNVKFRGRGIPRPREKFRGTNSAGKKPQIPRVPRTAEKRWALIIWFNES